MKVISGTLKGRKILGYQNPTTRPTMDRVKESIFAMIQDNLQGSIVLDLFSGTGSLAIEALSQGAKYAVGNDNDKGAYQIMQKNRTNLHLEEKLECFCFDFLKCLDKLHKEQKRFDLIFLDPPYQTNYIATSLEDIEKKKLLRESGKIICETNDLQKIPQDLAYRIVKQKKYGNKMVVILEKLC